MTRLSLVLTMALFPLLVEAVMAETPEPPPSPPRVRVTAPSVSGKRLVGTIVALDDTILTLQPQGAGEKIRIPRAAIARLEASRRRSRKPLGAGIGLLAGIGAAVAIHRAADKTCERAGNREGADQAGALFTCLGSSTAGLLGEILSIPAGALIGRAVAPSEKWEETTADHLRLTVGAGHGGGLRAGLAIRF
jgi:hypothetical protein